MIKVGMAYYPEHWDRSLWEEDAARMKALGVHVVRLAEFAWGRMEPEEGRFDFSWLDEAIDVIARHGMQVILCTPTNSAPVWLYTDHPETVQWGRNGRPTDIGIRGHRCIQSPVFRRYAGRIVDEMARRYAGRPEVYAWQIDNELESNHCTCPSCREAFRRWLEEKYGTVAALNRAWGTDVWSGQITRWDQVQPLLAPDCLPDWHNPAFMLDYERFAAWCTADYVRWQRQLIRHFDPDAIVTTNSCFCGNMPDFHQEFAQLDVAAYDNYPPMDVPEDPETLYSNAFALDFIRGFKRKNFWILEQLGGAGGCWSPMGVAPEPGMIEGYAMQTVAHGADLVSFFRWRSSCSGAEMLGHGVLDHDNRDNRRLAEIGNFCRRLEKLPALDETGLHSDVALLYGADQEFALKNQRQSRNFAYWTQLKLFHDACMGLGVNVDVVAEDTPLDGYKAVLVPTHYVTDRALAERLEAFAAAGGTAVLTNRSGVKDAHNNCIFGETLPTAFRKLCGCRVEEYDAIGERRMRIASVNGGSYLVTGWCDILEPEGAQVWARYTEKFYAGAAAVTKNAFGAGRAYYVGAVGERALYRALLTEIFRELSIPVVPGLPDGVEVTTRSGAEGCYRFFFNNTLRGKSFALGERRVTLRPLEMKIETEGGEWL